MFWEVGENKYTVLELLGSFITYQIKKQHD